MQRSSGLPSLQELNEVVESAIGRSVARPEGKTLAGHSSGLPFEDLIHGLLVNRFPEQVLRQYEALNRNLKDHPEARTADERVSLLGDPALQLLLKRGSSAMASWSEEQPFEVKQDDTAESIIFSTSRCDLRTDSVILLDVKTQDVSKKGQAPNIMSADKLARASVLALAAGRHIPFDIVYAGIKWRAEGNRLVCEDARAISLLKITPPLYINWVAAQQIQFHPFAVDQEYAKSPATWCQEYLKFFCKSLGERIKKEEERLEFFLNALDD